MNHIKQKNMKSDDRQPDYKQEFVDSLMQLFATYQRKHLSCLIKRGIANKKSQKNINAYEN